MDELTDQPPPAAGTPAERGNTSPTQPPVPRTGDDGAPIYDQEFFLALARCGRDVWNEWRTGHSSGDDKTYVKVTFAKVDFRTDAISRGDRQRGVGIQATERAANRGSALTLEDSVKRFLGLGLDRLWLPSPLDH